MADAAEKTPSFVEAFDEKEFYLDEFRGRTLLFSVSLEELRRDDGYARLAAITRELLANDTRVLAIVDTPEPVPAEHVVEHVRGQLAPLIFRDDTLGLFLQKSSRAAAFSWLDAGAFATPHGALALLTTVWITLRRGPLLVGVLPATTRAVATRFAQHTATRLRVHKLVLVEPDGGIAGTDGKQMSFMDETVLAALLTAGQAEWAGMAPRRATLEVVRTALLGGVASVNLCTLAGGGRELFTYEGSGTLFTLKDYCTVHRLGVDDFEEVERLIERGQREGILKVRSPEEVAALLVNGYGATMSAHHLSGICALVTEPYTAERAGEISGLYTITRFKGEGVGARLVACVVDEARTAGLSYVFACTTEERAQVFFERQHFHRVGHDAVPAAKWIGYDPQRKAQVAVFRLDMTEPPA